MRKRMRIIDVCLSLLAAGAAGRATLVYATDVCNNGIAGIQAENVCCLAECGACGGSYCNRLGDGLGRENCCVSGIRETGSPCSVTREAPCIVDDEAESTPSPVTAAVTPEEELQATITSSVTATLTAALATPSPAATETFASDDNVLMSFPTPSPTAAIDSTTPMPTSDTVCSNGLSGIQVGDACCKAGCAQCGGTECSTNTGVSGYGTAECCVDKILSAGIECGGDVVAPCINYDTPAATPAPALIISPALLLAGTLAPASTPFDPSCAIQKSECIISNSCRQCLATSIDDVGDWQKCVADFDVDEAGSCAELEAMACCYAEVSSNSACLNNEQFLSYVKCFVGMDCLPLTCSGTMISSTNTASGTGRLSSPLSVARSGGASAATVVMALAIVIVTILQV